MSINAVSKNVGIEVIQCPVDVTTLSSEEKYDRAFLGFPPEEMFRLFIDKSCQHKGAEAFDLAEPWL